MTNTDALCVVTSEERDKILQLYERKNGLKELFVSLTGFNKDSLEDNALYSKIVDDMSKTQQEYQHWWDTIVAKYKLVKREGHHWQIKFDSREIYIVKDS